MSFHKAYIAGITIALPTTRVHLMDLDFDTKRIERTIQLTGIEDTCLAEPDKTAADYDIAAARHLLNSLNVLPNEIDGVLFVSGYPDYIQPATAGVIQRQLGIQKNCVALDINHVCSGFIYGLLQGYMLIETGMCRNVLLCMGDIAAARAIHKKDFGGRMVAGDSGAAILIRAKQNNNLLAAEFSFYHDGSGAEKLGILVGANRYPKQVGITNVEHTDENGNTRTAENWHMDGMAVMEFAMDCVQPKVDEVIRKCGWEKEDINVFGFHQANEFIVKKLIRQMKISPDRTPIYVKHTGNLGPDSIPWALYRHSKTEDSRNWKKCILCGFGAGLSVGVVGLDLSKTKFIDHIEV